MTEVTLGANTYEVPLTYEETLDVLYEVFNYRVVDGLEYEPEIEDFAVWVSYYEESEEKSDDYWWKREDERQRYADIR